MKITKDTKISNIIKENKNAIDVIATINKSFRKLKNPFLRKLFAPRVSVKDAAKIGRTTGNEILKKLEEIGFEVEYNKKTDNKNNIKINKMKYKKVITLDVRPILNLGTDPYHAIMSSLRTMKNEETLLIINSFEPVPLLNKLQKKGYIYEVKRLEENVVHTYLTQGKVIPKKDKNKVNEVVKLSFEELEIKFKGKMNELDVRPLEMPLPMVTILQEVEKISDDEALYVHHKKLPQYLLPELETRNFIYASKEIDDGNIKFIIYKNKK